MLLPNMEDDAADDASLNILAVVGLSDDRLCAVYDDDDIMGLLPPRGGKLGTMLLLLAAAEAAR